MNDTRTNGDAIPASGPDRTGRVKPRCRLVGRDGNVFNIIGIVRRALINAGTPELAAEFVQRATSARSYDEVLGLCFEYVDVR